MPSHLHWHYKQTNNLKQTFRATRKTCFLHQTSVLGSPDFMVGSLWTPCNTSYLSAHSLEQTLYQAFYINWNTHEEKQFAPPCLFSEHPVAFSAKLQKFVQMYANFVPSFFFFFTGIFQNFRQFVAQYTGH